MAYGMAKVGQGVRQVFPLSNNFPFGSGRRFNVTLAQVNSNSIVTKAYLDSQQPRHIRKLKPFQGVPPADLPKHFFEKLNGSYGNPRSILRTYMEYSKITDYPDYNWLLRCFSQLGNCFGYNSYWATRDKQLIQSSTKFRELVHDVVEKSDQMHPRFAPKVLYAMAALEYRSHLLLRPVLETIDANLHRYKPSVLAVIAGSLANLGIGNVDSIDSQNCLGPKENLSKDFSGLISRCVQLILSSKESLMEELLPTDWSLCAYALAAFGDYHGGSAGEMAIPICLRNASKLAGDNIKQSGWNQYYLYQVLYGCDVEKPSNEIMIKKAIPLPLQKELHVNWLDNIVLNAQPQGSEILQKEFDEVLCRLKVRDALINCSAGRPFDEQHCWFAGHLIKSRDLAIDYDAMQPLGPNRPRSNGHLQMKKRMLNHFGLNVVTVHKCFWDTLEGGDKDLMAARLLANFPLLMKPQVIEKPGFDEDRNLRRTAKSVPQKWPIEVYVKY